MKWKAFKHSRYGTTYHCSGEDWIWRINLPRDPSSSSVDLCFGRRDPGQIAPNAMEIGSFASPAEAMLAASMFVEGATHAAAAAVRESFGFTPYFDGAEKFEPAGGKAGYFLFLTGVGQDKKETGLQYEPPGRRSKTHNIARIGSSTHPDPDIVPAATPEASRAVEEAILMELFRLRLERGHGHYHEPLTFEEYKAWEVARYGVVADPDADRPYTLAAPDIRHAVAMETLFDNTEIQARFGITPGFEERVANRTSGMDDTLDELVLANLRGEERTAFLDQIDQRVLDQEAKATPSI